jgi:hypothetical protein
LVKHETGVASGFILSEKLENSVQTPGLDKGGPICGSADTKTQVDAETEAGLISKSFRWITSWGSSAARAQHGGRASMSYMQSHPDDESVHVVIG